MSDVSTASRSVSPQTKDTTLGPATILKRKAAADEVQAATSKRAAKRMKSKRSTEPKAGDVYAEIDEDSHVNPAIARMDGRLIADYIARQTKRFEPELSLVELEDRRIPEHAFVDTSDWTRNRDLENVAEFLGHFAGTSKKSLSNSPSETNGCPHTIVVASAGLRAADLTRSLRVYQSKSAAVAKLFAKHIKLKDAISSTKNTRMNIGVGTPQRLMDLVEQGALSLERVERIVVDASHVNAKKRGIFDMPETEVPLTQWLAHKELVVRYGPDAQGRRVRILMY